MQMTIRSSNGFNPPNTLDIGSEGIVTQEHLGGRPPRRWTPSSCLGTDSLQVVESISQRRSLGTRGPLAIFSSQRVMKGGLMPIKSVVEYIDAAERELAASEESTGHSTESRYHIERAQVFATLALARATYDQAG
jgi:hypothetical protein